MISVLGENITDLIASENGLFLPHTGGSPFNFAIGLGKHGIPCHYLSPISTDSFGEAFLEKFRENNVKTTPFNRSPYPSSLAIVTFDEAKNPVYCIYREKVADRDTSAEHLLSILPTETRILHTGSLALEPNDLKIVLPVLEEAKAKGIKISVDLNIRERFVSDKTRYFSGLEQILPLCDYLKASDEDLNALYPLISPNDAIKHVMQNTKDCLFAYTEGEKGATLYTPNTQLSLPIIESTNFVDTIGAGDTFYSTLLAYIYEHDLDKCNVNNIDSSTLKFALTQSLVAASINISRRGCNPPTKEELQYTLCNYNG